MLLYTLLVTITSLQACRKDGSDTTFPNNTKATLSIEFDNIVGEQHLQLNTGTYTNSYGETNSISLLQYFISNISVQRADGSTYTAPQDSSYFLVKESDASTRFARVQVP